MKKLMTLLALLPLVALSDQVRILPLGDSITEGIGWEDGGGYRAVLREKLIAAGYDVKFVGSNTTYNAGIEGFLHEGHGGWYLYTIHEALAGWMSTTEDPHVILLMIGTNDFGGHFDYKNILYRLSGLLDDLAEKQPSAKIIVSTLTPRTEAWDENYLKPYYNNGLPALVAEHQAKGQQVSMIDLYSALTRGTPATGGDFPDELHPNEGGYRKMAQAWFEGIQSVLPVTATTNMAPNRLAVVQTTLESDRLGVRICFNRRVSNTAEVLSNYIFSGRFQPTSVAIAEDRRSVLLRGGPAFPRDEFTRVKIRNVTCEDGAPIDERIVEVCQPYGAEHYVSEAANYRRIYALDIPVRSQYKDQPVNYLVDERSSVTDFSRVAYYLELEKSDGTVKYAWVSMDKFTNDVSKLGVPTRASGAVFQQYVNNLKVWSNQETVKPGEKARGNIEFWPYNYAQTPALGIGVAKQDCYDVDDTCNYEWDYASMQIHDTDALTPIICYNNWGNGDSDACLGIGAGPVYDWSSRDWTMANNAGEYVRRRLEVYILEDGASASAPSLVSSSLTPSGTRLELVFDKAIATADCTPDRFALSDGTRVSSVARADGGKRLVLTLAARPADGTTLAVSSIHSSVGTAVPFSGSVPVPSPTLVPAEVSARVGAKADGYQIVYAADIPVGHDWGVARKVDYRLDERSDIPFDRAAFFMALTSQDGSATNWIWVSMDKYTAGLSAHELSIPVCWDGAPGRYLLANLEVDSNVSGVTTGTHATGVAELWDSDYYAGRGDESFGGSADTYDWNDWWNTGNLNKPLGEYGQHGCFQFFATSGDLTTGETLFAINHWGESFASMDVGIGTCPSSDPAHFDWSYENNAGQYGTRRIYAFVRPVSTHPTDVPAEVTDKVGNSADGFKLLYRIDLESSMTVNNGNYGDMTVNTETYSRIHGVNNAKTLAHYGYSRVAYCLELVRADTHATNWIWTAFDWQGGKFAALDIPTAEGGISAMIVTNLEVKSNVSSITTGSNFATGNIEFTPYNYWTPNNNYNNTYIVPNASQDRCDFGDHLYGLDNDGVGHFGCMQVHNHDTNVRQTLWAVNHFNGGSDAGSGIGVGIGNNSGYHPDWTNEQTGDQYEKMTLYVMIQTCPRVEPQLAVISQNRRQVSVTCLNEVAVVNPSWFSVDGNTPSAASVSSSDPHAVILDFDTALSDAGSHTVRISVPGAAEVELTCASPRALPDCLASVDEASGYVLVNDLAIPDSAPRYSAKGVDYITEECRFGNIPFDRVGYLFELKSKNLDDYRWVWVSMDKFTDNLAQIAVPTVDNGAFFQKLVSNLHVEAGATSGAAPVRTGTWADGNIEFTPFDYGAWGMLGLAGASNDAFDYDDNLYSQAGAGYGCLQVHNYREGQTVFAFNNFNYDSNGAPDVTIGNATGDGVNPDATLFHNAQRFEIINLRVFVRPTSIVQNRGDGPAFYLQPEGAKYLPNRLETITLKSLAPEANAYQWFKDGKILLGETACDLAVPATRESAGVYHVVAYFDNDNYTVSDPAELKVKGGLIIRFR